MKPNAACARPPGSVRDERQVRRRDVDRPAPRALDPAARRAPGRSGRGRRFARAITSGSTSIRPPVRAPAAIRPPAQPNRIRPSRRGAQVVQQRAAVADRLAAGPADRLDDVRDGLGEHDVARGHREPVAQRRAARRSPGRPRRPRRRRARGPCPSPRPRRRGRARAVPSWMRTPRASRRSRRPKPSRAGCTVAPTADLEAAGEQRRVAARAHLRRRRARRRPRPRRRTNLCSWPGAAWTMRCGAAWYQASTPSASHQAPIARTDASAAATSSSPARTPNSSCSVGRLSVIAWTKPPLRPLGPKPQRSASSTTNARVGLGLEHVPRRPHAGEPAADDDDVGVGVLVSGGRPAADRPRRSTSRGRRAHQSATLAAARPPACRPPSAGRSDGGWPSWPSSDEVAPEQRARRSSRRAGAACA